VGCLLLKQTCSWVAFWFDTNIRPTIRNLMHRMRAIGVLGLALLVRFGIFSFPPSFYFFFIVYLGKRVLLCLIF